MAGDAMTRIGDHLRWPCISTAIREAHQDLSDAEWTGGNVQAAQAMVDTLIRERNNGVTVTPPF